MNPHPFITDFLLAAARRESPAAELRCRAILERAACIGALHAAFQREMAWGGLTVPGFKILAVLRAHEPGAVLRATVAAAAGLTPSRAGSAVIRLEISRLVRRQRDAGDRRRVWLRLTPAGTDRINDAIRRFVAGVVAVTGAMDEPDLAACISISRKLHAGLTRLNQPTPPTPAVSRS